MRRYNPVFTNMNLNTQKSIGIANNGQIIYFGFTVFQFQTIRYHFKMFFG